MITINVHDKLNTMITLGWFELKGSKITGGNSRILYDQANDQFLVDTQNQRKVYDDPTVYEKIPVHCLTKLPLHKDSKSINLLGWNNQYLSESKTKTTATTFLYNGYKNISIFGETSLKSSAKIRYITDNYNFFIAITDCDIYLTNIYYNTTKAEYYTFTGLMSSVVCESERAQVYEQWSCIDVIVYIEGRFFFLSKNKFYVYETCPKQFVKLYEADCVNNSGDLYSRLFVEIDKYYESCK